MSARALLAAAAALLPSLTLAQACPEGALYPGSDWTDRTAEVRAARPEAVQALEAWAFTLTGKDEERLGLRTDGLVVVQDGQILYENYGRGFTKDKRHLLWSTTKSITGLLAGIAVKQGVLAVDDSLCKHRPDLSAACDITVRNLLEMASGFDWAEVYEDGEYQQSSVLAMLYGQGREAVVPFVAGHKRRAAPGTAFRYSTGDAHLLMGVVRAALKPEFGDEYPWTLLMDKLGVRSFTLERDAALDFHGGSFGYLTPRDMARVGTFMLHDGCWAGERILPEGWMASTRTVNPAFKGTPKEEDTAYGWQTWLNRAVPEIGLELPYPDAPGDTFFTAGHWGQYIIVVPSKRLVIARTGDDRKSVPNKVNDLIKHALPLAAGVAQ